MNIDFQRMDLVRFRQVVLNALIEADLICKTPRFELEMIRRGGLLKYIKVNLRAIVQTFILKNTFITADKLQFNISYNEDNETYQLIYSISTIFKYRYCNGFIIVKKQDILDNILYTGVFDFFTTKRIKDDKSKFMVYLYFKFFDNINQELKNFTLKPLVHEQPTNNSKRTP